MPLSPFARLIFKAALRSLFATVAVSNAHVYEATIGSSLQKGEAALFPFVGWKGQTQLRLCHLLPRRMVCRLSQIQGEDSVLHLILSQDGLLSQNITPSHAT